MPVCISERATLDYRRLLPPQVTRNIYYQSTGISRLQEPNLTLLRSAEVGHTCFAAIDRFENGQPRFKKIDDRVSVHGTNSSTDGRLILKSNGAEAKTGDWISRVDNWWKITSNRIADEVCDTLESWSDYDWSRRTGYLHATQNPRTAEIVFTFQLRDSIRQGNDRDLRFHEFWQEFGGDLTSKPVWSIIDGQQAPIIQAALERTFDRSNRW